MNVFNICSNEDLRFAYSSILTFGEKMKKEFLDEYKRKIRAFQKQKPTSWVISDDGECVIVLERLPKYIRTKADAYDYFEEYKYLDAPNWNGPSGQIYTIRYKLVERNGQWFAYHWKGVSF